MVNPWTEDKLLRPIEWPLRIVAVVLAIISATEIYSELSLPNSNWALIMAALLFGFWFGYLGVTGRRPGEVVRKLKPWGPDLKRKSRTAWDLAQERMKGRNRPLR